MVITNLQWHPTHPVEKGGAFKFPVAPMLSVVVEW